jgi:hydrogenase expression/formation protein HypE
VVLDKQQTTSFSCPSEYTGSDVIRLGHGSGGKMTANLIENVFMPLIGNDILKLQDDAAVVTAQGTTLAITTDSYVVSPIIFPGGDIGSLSVYGTVNDLAMRGALPLYITASFILEEGLPIELLSKVIRSINQACLDTNVTLVAGDTKVVNKGAADKLFITTSGVGLINKHPSPSASRAQVGDCILLSGDIGRHGVAVMSCREGLDLETTILSDSAPLHRAVHLLLTSLDNIHTLRDITRGGLAGVLNELSASSNVGIVVEEDRIPIHPEVGAVCEILGLDPLYVACEGRFVAIVSEADAEEACSIMSTQPGANKACIIGKVVNDHPGRVVLRSRVGGHRIIDKLSGEQLPRIC